MGIGLASPLFILRRECKEDLFAVLDKIKAIGFDGVEFFSFFGNSAESVRDKMKELDMIPCGNHVDYEEFLSDTKDIIKLHKKVGCRYITIGGISRDGLPGGGRFPETVKQLMRIGHACREEGISLLYHNHAVEMDSSIFGKYMLEVILDQIPASCLGLEPDLGWMLIGGAEPAYFLEKYENRCPVIHLKDFYASDMSMIGNPADLNGCRGTDERGCFEFRPAGYGIANIPVYIDKALQCEPEWIVIDHDAAYERSIYKDLELSLSYVRNLLELVH